MTWLRTPSPDSTDTTVASAGEPEIQGWVSGTRSGTDRRSSTATNATTAAAVAVARTTTTMAKPATGAAANEVPPMRASLPPPRTRGLSNAYATPGWPRLR